jgi:hypothetical protein
MMKSLLLLISAIWCLGAPLHAGLSAPIPFAKLSQDESRILVVRNGGKGFSPSQVDNPRLTGGVEIDFLNDFPRSGVYRLPSRDLVYEIDWFCLEHELLASDDLDHIARLNRFGTDWALKFYSSGKETSTFKIEQLLTAFSSERFRPFSTWDYYHPWHEDLELRGGLVRVTTVEREVSGFELGYFEVHTFDPTTGMLKSTKVHNGLLNILLGVAGLLIFLATSVFLALRAKRNQSKRKHSR